MGAKADAAALEQLREARASSAPCAGCRRAGRSQVEPALERWEAAFAELNGE